MHDCLVVSIIKSQSFVSELSIKDQVFVVDMVSSEIFFIISNKCYLLPLTYFLLRNKTQHFMLLYENEISIE